MNELLAIGSVRRHPASVPNAIFTPDLYAAPKVSCIWGPMARLWTHHRRQFVVEFCEVTYPLSRRDGGNIPGTFFRMRRMLPRPCTFRALQSRHRL